MHIAEGMVTVAELRWTTDEPGQSWVEYGVDGAFDLSTPMSAAADTRHQHELRGLPSNRLIQYRASTLVDGRELHCTGEVLTPWLPSNISRYEVTVYDPERVSSPWVMMANAGQRKSAPVIVNRAGEVVWYRERESGMSCSQVEAAADGSGLYVFVQDGERAEPTLSAIHKVSWAGVPLAEIPVWGAHHRFTQLPDGRLAYVAVDVREWQESAEDEPEWVVGDRIMELDPNGKPYEIFSTWDALEPEREISWLIPFYPGKSDWTHGNGLVFEPVSGTYLLSLANLDSIMEVEQASGDVRRIIGDREYSFSPGTPSFNYQHAPRWTDDGTLLLTTTDSRTYAVEYAVDDENKVLTEVWSYGQEEDILAVILSDVQRLANGNTLISYGIGAVMQEVTPEGEVVWQLEGEEGQDVLTSVQVLDDLYALR